MDAGRGDAKVWVDGGRQVRAGQHVSFTAPFARKTVGDLTLPTRLDAATPAGEHTLVSAHRSGQTSGPIQEWLGTYPRVHPVPIPAGACWLDVQAR
jgi:hypothetical protein